ncbi:MAG TPA: response regulator [Gammaproteobacteria bacterium]|nr:response regulator [Gammaproteobacteria bacterium]
MPDTRLSLTARSSFKDNPEFGQAIVRMLIWITVTALVFIGAYSDYYPGNYLGYLLFTGIFLVVSLFILYSIVKTPRSRWRVYATIPFDVASISAVMLLTESGPFSPWFLFYPWIYIGYGVRYGRVELFSTAILSFFAFIFIVFYTGNWQAHSIDTIAYSIFMLTLPFYLNIMIGRIKRAQQEADRANYAKSEFLATMSHEIRTPMTGILGMTELLEETKLDETQKDYVEGLKESSVTLHSLINDVLDLSKIEAGKYQLDHSPFNLERVVKTVVNIFLPQTDKKGIRLEYQLQAGLPEMVVGDHNRLRQILLNLISNAVKYTDEGYVRLTVHKPDDKGDIDTLHFEIEDTGIGIEKDQLQHIFEPFYQCQTDPAEQRHGTGLGTTISSKLVNTMYGSIGVNSVYGKGSTFWFKLPLPVVDSSAHTQISSRAPEGDSARKLKIHILLAEDTPIVAKVISTFLKQEGYRVTHANNGKETLDALKKSADIDLVLMDMRMPQMNGLEVTRRWRQIEEQGKHIPIIALTANSTTIERDQCFAAGMDHFITKPVSRARLFEVIHEFY